MVNPTIDLDYRKFTTRLMQQGVDTRPIVSGNMALQPALRHFNVDLSMGPFTGAQAIHERGLFIGCHAKALPDATIARLVELILGSLHDSSR